MVNLKDPAQLGYIVPYGNMGEMYGRWHQTPGSQRTWAHQPN